MVVMPVSKVDFVSEKLRSGSPAVRNACDSPLRAEVWKNDARWPVREMGPVQECANNCSLDGDISIARRTMRAHNERRVGMRMKVNASEFGRPHSTPIRSPLNCRPHSTGFSSPHASVHSTGLPSLSSSARPASSLPSSSPAPFSPSTSPVGKLAGGLSMTMPAGGFRGPHSARSGGDQRSQSAMGMTGSARGDQHSHIAMGMMGSAGGDQRSHSAMGMVAHSPGTPTGWDSAMGMTGRSSSTPTGRDSAMGVTNRSSATPTGRDSAMGMRGHSSSTPTGHSSAAPIDRHALSRVSTHASDYGSDSRVDDDWFPMSPRQSIHNDDDASSSPNEEAPIPTGHDPPQTRPELIRWCFRHKRETIAARLVLLDKSAFSEEHRNLIYVQREDDPDEDEDVWQLLDLFNQLGLKKLPQLAHPSALEGWALHEGGCSRTSELLTAFEVLNFYRWLCGVPRLKLDSFRQELSELLLQALTKRDPRVHMSSDGLPHLHEFFEGVSTYVKQGGGRAIVVSHVPSAPAAMRLLFMATPERSNTGIPPPTIFGADLVASDSLGVPLKLPRASAIALRDYLPFLRLTCIVEGQDDVGPSPPLSKMNHSLHGSSTYGRSLSLRHRKVQVVHAAGPTALDGHSRKPHKVPAWGDLRGTVSFRRSALDPKLRSTGLMRRGCRTCLWIDEECEGAPEQLHEDDLDNHLAPNFLDKEIMQETAQAKASSPLKDLQRWRDDVSRRLTCGEFVEAKGKSTLGGDAATFHDQGNRKSILGIPVIPAKNPFPGSAFETQNLELEELAKEDDFQDHGIVHDHHHTLADDEHPLIVCFPPPGIVPLEEVCDVACLVWTISPDPLRLTPTPNCRVQIFRVRIDVERGLAERLGNDEVPLESFCVDCSNVGTPFCIVFTLSVDVQSGDQFEVVLSGLAGPTHPCELLPDVAYFVSFESFRPSVCDVKPLRRRAADLLKVYREEYLWQEPVLNVPGDNSDDDALPSVSLGTNSQAKKSVRSGRRGTSRQNSTVVGARGLMKKVDASTLAAYTARSPPPIGIVSHPNALEQKDQNIYTIEVPSGNEVYLALLVTSKVVLKATLLCFVKSSAKWEVLPHAVFINYYNDECSSTSKDNPTPTVPPGCRDVTAPFRPLPSKKHRLVIRVMLPLADVPYELRFHWGFVPGEGSRSLLSSPMPYEHPLQVALVMPKEVPGFRPLVPTLYHPTVKRFGYPMKHPLMDHFGVTLVGPMRYRLRMGYVRFTVYVKQGIQALDEKDAHLAGAALVDAAEAEEGLEALNEPGPLSVNSDDDDTVSNLTSAAGGKRRRQVAKSHLSTASIMSGSTEPIGYTSELESIVGSPVLQSVPALVNPQATLSTAPDGANQDDGTHVRFAGATEECGDSDSDAGPEDQFERAGPRRTIVDEALLTVRREVVLEDIQRRVKKQLSRQIRRSTASHICIVAVVGSWRRIELLRCRPLDPPTPPAAVTALAGTEGSAVAAAAASVAVATDMEVHEAVLHITDEDQAQPIQLLAFQIGAADALDNLPSGALSAPSGGADAEATGTRQTMVAGLFRKGPMSAELPPPVPPGDMRGGTKPAESPLVRLGTMAPPSRWCIGEFLVEGAHPLPFDEDEMEKPPSPPRDPLEVIGFVGASNERTDPIFAYDPFVEKRNAS